MHLLKDNRNMKIRIKDKSAMESISEIANETAGESTNERIKEYVRYEI